MSGYPCECGQLTEEHCARSADIVVRAVPRFLRDAARRLGSDAGLARFLRVSAECADVIAAPDCACGPDHDCRATGCDDDCEACNE